MSVDEVQSSCKGCCKSTADFIWSGNELHELLPLCAVQDVNSHGDHVVKLAHSWLLIATWVIHLWFHLN